MAEPASSDDQRFKKIAGAFVLMMGTVSLFGDMTYEGARSLTGPYFELLGASAAAVGFAAGLGEFVGYALRLVSGWIGEKTKAYWALVVTGYAINLIAVPGLGYAGEWQIAVGLLVLERLGKAIRSPARSTLVSYAANRAGAGKMFGLEEAMDQIGAVAGPLLCTAAIALGPAEETPVEHYQQAFKWLAGPALATLALVLLARNKFPKPESLEQNRPQLQSFGKLFGLYAMAAGLLGFGFCDWALVAFHGAKTGMIAVKWLPALYSAAMGVDAIAALTFGRLFDKYGIGTLALAAVISAGFAPLVFLAPAAYGLLLGGVLWAASMGAQESIFKAAIATLVPKEQRSRAYGLFFALFGLTWWLGSTLLGWLYEHSISTMVAVSVVAQLLSAPLFLVVASRARAAAAR